MNSLRFLICLCVVVAICSVQTVRSERLRIIIETDAGGDPDDEQSLVRFLLYANEWDVEGIIANRPEAREGENLNTERTGIGIVRRQVEAYGACHANLVQHDPRYPTRDELMSRTVPGDASTDAGARLIIAAVDRDDPRPVWFCNWGTDDGAAPSCLRRALDEILAERGSEGYAKFKNRLRLSSADKFGKHTFDIAPAFPIWVDTFRPEVDRRRWYHRFSAITATAGGFDIERDVRHDHGPLGALYPTNTTHPQKEGDTGTFLYLVPTGMNDPLQPGWGSWAGRYGIQDDAGGRPYYWANVADTWQGTTHRENTLARWAADLQNDFRARLDWCAKPRGAANHPPLVRLTGESRLRVKPGDRVTLDANGSTDPDGDALNFAWIPYPEATNFSPANKLHGADTAKFELTVPNVDQTQDAHWIVAVTDHGAPPLTRYARVILTIEPR